MNITIKATNIELTNDISQYVDKKIGSVSKYLGEKADVVLVSVEVGRSTHHQSGEIYRAEVHITGGGFDLYAEESSEDIFSAVDKVQDEIEREVRKTKGKETTMARKGGAIVKSMAKGFYWKMNKFKLKGFKINKKNK